MRCELRTRSGICNDLMLGRFTNPSIRVFPNFLLLQVYRDDDFCTGQNKRRTVEVEGTVELGVGREFWVDL